MSMSEQAKRLELLAACIVFHLGEGKCAGEAALHMERAIRESETALRALGGTVPGETALPARAQHQPPQVEGGSPKIHNS